MGLFGVWQASVYSSGAVSRRESASGLLFVHTAFHDTRITNHHMLLLSLGPWTLVSRRFRGNFNTLPDFVPTPLDSHRLRPRLFSFFLCPVSLSFSSHRPRASLRRRLSVEFGSELFSTVSMTVALWRIKATRLPG